MKKIVSLFSASSLFILPVIAFAQGLQPDGGEFGELLGNIIKLINGTLIPFILGIGFLCFVWGMFWYFIAGGANEEKRKKGKDLMIWSVTGFVIIIVFWGVINLIVNSFDLNTAPPITPVGPTPK